jgi:hypothetical protein
MKIELLNNNYYLTKNEFEFYYKWKVYVINKWFYFNGWSIPRLLWAICHPFLYPYIIAFLIHDYMYSKKFPDKITRNECDKFFMQNLSLHNKIIWIIFYIWVYIWWKNNFKKDLPFDKKLYLKLKIKTKWT